MNATNRNSRVFFLEWSEQVGNKTWFDFIVAINKANIITSGFLDTDIASGRLPVVFLMDDFDAFVGFGIIINYFFGTVGGAIIDKNNFEIVIGLR